MSKHLEEAKLSVISDINKIFKKNKYPMLPIDENPIQGDISIICFPGAQTLKKSPEEVAKNVSEMISHIKLIKETFVVKAFCNIVLDWDFLLEDIFSEIKLSEYGRGVSKHSWLRQELETWFFYRMLELMLFFVFGLLKA